MKKLLIGLLLLSGCGHNYIKLAKEVTPKTTTILIKTVVEQYTLSFSDGDLTIKKSTITATIGGAGVFISSKGHILTCAHLFNVGTSSAVIVRTSNGESYKGTLLYQDTSKDLALVKIDYTSPYAILASTSPEVGEEVMAVGNPRMLSFTVTKGIISYLHRDLDEPYNFTQTDTPINPGNSGGPLFNTNGELVGINARKIEGDGLGFAVSLRTIKEFLDTFKGLPQ